MNMDVARVCALVSVFSLVGLAFLVAGKEFFECLRNRRHVKEFMKELQKQVDAANAAGGDNVDARERIPTKGTESGSMGGREG